MRRFTQLQLETDSSLVFTDEELRILRRCNLVSIMSARGLKVEYISSTDINQPGLGADRDQMVRRIKETQ